MTPEGFLVEYVVKRYVRGGAVLWLCDTRRTIEGQVVVDRRWVPDRMLATSYPLLRARCFARGAGGDRKNATLERA